MNNQRLTVTSYVQGITSGDRMMLARAITLVESTLPGDQVLASEVIDQILSKTGNSVRIGITGVPGVGKSTFIEVFGNHVIGLGKKVAILTVDPSSLLTKGSILGDKTRMDELSKNPSAFIRPSASGNILGGVAGKTREAMLLCEAAGYEVILVETVGVGQSEVAVRNMTDFFLLLMLAGAGDELQGIKKGIMEMADAVVITKADGDNVKHATEAQSEYQHAMHLLPSKKSGWAPPVMISSAFAKTGIAEIWNAILQYHGKTSESGYFEENRHQQNITWFHDYFQQLLKTDFQNFDALNKTMNDLSESVGKEKISPYQGARKFLEAYHQAIRESRS